MTCIYLFNERLFCAVEGIGAVNNMVGFDGTASWDFLDAKFGEIFV